MKPIYVKSSTYTDFNVEDNDKDPKVGYHVRISNYKKTFLLSWSEVVFVIEKVQDTVTWIYVINYLNGEEIAGTFYKKELQKIKNQTEFIVEKVIKKKGDKPYVKWKSYDNLLNRVS